MSTASMKKTSEKQRAACHDDGLGKRRLKAVGDETHYWRWDAGYNVVAEYKDQTPDWDVGALQRFFVPFGHTALAEATPGAGGSVSNGTYTYLAHDHLGTTRKGYNQSQTEIHSNEHLPFGQRFSITGTVPYHEWTGKPWDADTQMYYFPYRYYSPMMNRWTATDPLGLVDGPNLYGYVGGNPIMHIDPEGGLLLEICIVSIAIMAGSVAYHGWKAVEDGSNRIDQSREQNQYLLYHSNDDNYIKEMSSNCRYTCAKDAATSDNGFTKFYEKVITLFTSLAQ